METEGIQYDTCQQEGWNIFVLRGSLDRGTAEETNSRGVELLATSAKLAVDLSGLIYISSAGIRVFLRLAKKARAEGKSFALCGATGFVSEVLKDANLDLLVDMCDSISQLH